MPEVLKEIIKLSQSTQNQNLGNKMDWDIASNKVINFITLSQSTQQFVTLSQSTQHVLVSDTSHYTITTSDHTYILTLPCHTERSRM